MIELGVEPRALSGAGAVLLAIAGDRVHRIDISALAAPADRQ
ncbi:hypothetical protein [Actinoplanes subtropicus]|nr:hypothetical protein [Actinoplanes subtropicus]